ncbi:hypothetical protein [Kitasatospora sp. MAP5-34]|uniref:hypothetical protein n=1 Tax=Kitasatospora sp. MAP5-34 TaxID=3035102 RepID=UPI00247716AC|nr:hypothetical protein [Kitasatospora sp. MAP5-34]MDH6575674.1 hypothetical protein [Kitasatospora sp. MAP5-34]
MRALVLMLVGFAVVGLLMLLLRWAYGSGKSLVAREPRIGGPDEYGLLVPVAAPADAAEAEQLASRLAAAGLHYTLAPTSEGLRLMVWPADEQAARRALGR